MSVFQAGADARAARAEAVSPRPAASARATIVRPASPALANTDRACAAGRSANRSSRSGLTPGRAAAAVGGTPVARIGGGGGGGGAAGPPSIAGSPGGGGGGGGPSGGEASGTGASRDGSSAISGSPAARQRESLDEVGGSHRPLGRLHAGRDTGEAVAEGLVGEQLVDGARQLLVLEVVGRSRRPKPVSWTRWALSTWSQNSGSTIIGLPWWKPRRRCCCRRA